MINVICMKWGDKYPASHVNVLRSMVLRNLRREHRFVCFTDDPTGIDATIEVQPLPPCALPARPGAEVWRKIGLFHPALPLSGPTLFLDLDIVVTGPLEPFFDVPGEFCIIHDWTHPARRLGNGSVFRFVPGRHQGLWEEFERAPDRIADAFGNEQRFVATYVDRTVGLTWWPAEFCRSFIRHSLPRGPAKLLLRSRLPDHCRILVFHGSPDPAEAVRSWRYGRRKLLRPFKLMRPASWLSEYWR